MEAKTLTKDDAFNVLECGAGNGNLCYHIINIIQKMAEEKQEWQSLFKSLHYYMVEKSPAVVKVQIERNKEFKEKVHVTQGDALDLKPLLNGIKIGAAISNELIDMLPPHVVKRDRKKGLLVQQVLPFIHENLFKEIVDDKSLLKRLQEESSQYKKMLNANAGKLIYDSFEEIAAFIRSELHLLLSEASFLELHSIISKGVYADQFHFVEVAAASIDKVPEIKTFKERHPQFFTSMRPHNSRIVTGDIYRYLAGVREKLLPDGEIITVDYSNNDHEVEHNLRTFRNHEPYYDI